MVNRVLKRLRQPEYTGENRCLPCTVINTGIAIVLGAAVAFVSLPAALSAFAASVVVITLRGYLVPGTPTLVQYLPNEVHEAIGPEHDFEGDTPGSRAADTGTVDVESTLRASGIVVECQDADDLCMTDEYRDAWHEEMTRVRDEQVQREHLGALLSVPPADLRFEETDTGWSVFVDDLRAGNWQSRAAFRADLANERLLSSWLTDRDWRSVSAEERTEILVSLRTFVETCPECGGDVVADESVVRSCCRDDILSVTTACVDCEAVLFKGTDA